MILKSEFAIVQVLLDETANGPRLMIRDLQSGDTIHLDPLELEALTRLRHGDLREYLDPSFEPSDPVLGDLNLLETS